MKILNFGSSNIDYVYTLDHIVRPGETQTSNTLETFAGGKGLNQSIAVAKAGAEVYHAGYIGSDGEFLKKLLEDNDVNTSYIKKVDVNNGHAIIQVTKCGENSIFLYPGSNEMLSKEYIDNVLKDFGTGDIIVLQNEVNQVDYIVEKAYEKGATIVLNPSPYNEKIKNIDINKLSYLILNEVEAEDITGLKNPEDCLDFFKENYPKLSVVLTLGSSGSMFSGGETRIFQPAYKVEIVDTTAAGDTFTGYFIAGITKNENIASVMQVAACAAAIAVSRKGAAPSIPELGEVLKSLKNFKSNQSENKNNLLALKIDKYVDDNIKTANLNELANILGYSAVYTGGLVKKLMGVSFTAYLQKKRCEISAEMLKNTDLSVEEISEKVGYNNKTFFRKIFKEQYGKNPLAFRMKKH